MPVYSGAIGGAVYPIGLDMDWNSNAVAYGYQYCGFACQSLYRGYWLTFSDNQGAYPTNPQGASDAFNPTFYGTRVVSSDSGGNIFVQPDVPEAPFTSSYQGWLTHADGYYLSRAEVSPGQQPGRDRVAAGRRRRGHQRSPSTGTVPSDLVAACDLQVAAHSGNLTFSPDGSQMAWRDDEGIKVAGVPNMAAGTDDLHAHRPAARDLHQRPQPSFGGADVAAVGGAGGGPGRAAAPAGGGSRPAAPAAARQRLKVRCPRKPTRAAFAKGLTLKVTAAKAGRIDASASIPAKIARKVGLRGKAARRAARIASKGFAAAVGDGRRPRPREGQGRGHGQAPAQAHQGRQARRQADAQGRADGQGQPGRRRRHGQGQAPLAASGVLAASSLASTPRSAATSSSESTPPKRSSNAAANTAPMCANAAAPSRVSSARTTRRSWGADAPLTQPRSSRRSIRRVAPLRLTSSASASSYIVSRRPGAITSRWIASCSSSVVCACSSSRRLSSAAQLRVGAVQLRPRRRGARGPAGWAGAPPLDDEIVDGGKMPPPTQDAGASSSARSRSATFARPRCRRLITVPVGTPSAWLPSA